MIHGAAVRAGRRLALMSLSLALILWVLSGSTVASGAGRTAMLTAASQQARPAGSLLITEVYYDTPGDDAAEEWFEISNVGPETVALDGYKVGDEETPGGGEGMAAFPPGHTVQPGQSIVIAQTASGFRALFGRAPDFELRPDDPNVADMIPYLAWAGGDVALNNDGDEILLLDPNDVVVDALSYGDSVVFMQPAILDVARGQSLARAPAYCDSDRAADWQASAVPTPGAAAFDGPCADFEDERAGELLPIGVIQGRGDSSGAVNQIVSFEGIVTGLLEDRNTRGAIFYTLFVQDVPGTEDGDPLTSDAIAVFHGPRRPQYLPGDLVRVSGQVTEFYGLTEIDDSGLHIELLATGQPLPPATPLQPPIVEDAAYYEALEAMRVALPEAVVVGPTYSSCGLAVVPGNQPRRFVRQSLADPAAEIVPVLHISDVACGDFPQVQSGDLIQGLAGPLVYHFDQFKIVHQFASELTVTAGPTPDVPTSRPLAANELSVATFNVHDYFDERRDSSGADEPVLAAEQVELKGHKLAQTIGALLNCPTILAIQEVENLALLQRLAQRLQDICPFTYMVAHRESPDVRGIDLALMVDGQRAQIVDVRADQVCSPVTTDIPEIAVSCPAGQDPLFSRPPLHVQLLLDGEPYTVIVVHFKSKREGEEVTAARRLAQAGVVARMVQVQLQTDPDARLLVLGDFNDYEQSQPMAALTKGAAGLFNVAERVPRDLRYTYNFGGVSQLLDTILVSPELVPRLVEADILHVNADFPFAWADDEDLVFRSSDHDIPLAIFRLFEQDEAIEQASQLEPARGATPDGPSEFGQGAEPAPTEAEAVEQQGPAELATLKSGSTLMGLLLPVLLMMGAAFWLGRRSRGG